MTAPGRDYGRITGFKTPFATLYHSRGGAPGSGETLSFLPRDLLTPPYRITRPFSRFDEDSSKIAFDLDGREVWVERAKVELEKGSLGTRGQATLISLTLLSVRHIKVWYGPPPEEEVAAKGIRLEVKPLRIMVATFIAILFYLLVVQFDPLGFASVSDNYSNVLYQQIYRTGSYEEVKQSRDPAPRPPKVVVVELLEQDLKFYEETWPASYDFHAWVLEAIAERDPAAVFVDIAFIDDRSYLEEDDDPREADDETKDPQRFFGGTSEYLGEVIANYRTSDEIPLFFAATPCFPPFFLPVDVPEGAGTRAVDVPGGRYNRQGTLYPLWNHQKNQLCFRDTAQDERRSFANPNGTQAQSEAPAAPGDENGAASETKTDGVQQAGSEDTPQTTVAAVNGSIDRNQEGSKPLRARNLPSAACGVFDALRKLPAVNYGTDVCSPKAIQSALVPELNLHWSTRSFTAPVADGSQVQRNGRYPCRAIPGTWWERLLTLLVAFDKDSGFEFRSPLRQQCPPVRSLQVAQILDPAPTPEDPDLDPLGDLQGAVVIYAQNLTGVEDRFTPPAHWPLNGAYFHAMAIDNLLTYGGPEKLLQKNETLDLPNTLVLLLLGFLAVVPLWEYGMILLLRVERTGELARDRATAFRCYGLWLAGFVVLPLLTAAVVLEMVLVTTFLLPNAALNFVGLFALIGARSTPRLWRLVPPLWLGLGGWGRKS